MPATARVPTPRAASSLPRELALQPAGRSRRIQKIIQVTSTTATTEVMASNSSRCSVGGQERGLA